ncbi:MAG TPA: protein-disulfide reductase DsbD domain-containing protein [Verrucomicrobiae bacterium]|nr:protein-disulfide reductase DsbD domain-containing protein [Verrucomicrobiae bacterium]
MKRLLALLVAVFVALLSSAANAAHTRVSLLLSAAAARPGDTVLAAVRLQMDPGWHTYWRNGGESGGPTKIEWELPTGVSAEEAQWPVPEKYVAEGLVTYVYHDEAVLVVPLKLSSDLKPGALELKAKVSWLECERVCVPGDQVVSATLAIADATQPSADLAFIEAAKARLPGNASKLSTRAVWEQSVDEKTRTAILEWDAPKESNSADFYPDASPTFEISPNTENIQSQTGRAKLRLTVKKFEGDWPREIRGLLINKSGEQAQSFEAAVPVEEATTASTYTPKSAQSLGLMLFYAFIGGLILNIMPCVLPVIALKILGFVAQAKESPARVRALGLIYALGVIVSFLVLAGLVIGLKAAGQAAGWGMQFSSPQFTIAFSVLVTLVALNLFGVFEVTLGGGVMGAAGHLASRHGAGGAFFNGVLATVLATPCTAPFLSVALGFAFSQSAAIVILVFVTVGLGLASPYILLSWFPAWLTWLPKPGAWMERFKVAMGFPMLATALWLVSLVSDRYGERAWWLGIFLLFIGIAAWIFGEFIQRGQRHKVLAAAILAAFLALAYFWVLDGQLQWRRPIDSFNTTNAPLRNAPHGYVWQRWSADGVQKALAAGQPVIIDFTAKWCITCNTIVKPALSRPAVLDQFKRLNVAAFLADYTDYGAEIAAEMKRYDRAAVPLVLVFSPKAIAPVILPDPNPLLGRGHYSDLVIEALNGGK